MARQLGMTLRQLHEDMDADEFMLWAALEGIDPLPDPWLQSAMVCQTTANAFKSKGKPYPVERWLPIKRKQSSDHSRAKAFFSSLAAKS